MTNVPKPLAAVVVALATVALAAPVNARGLGGHRGRPFGGPFGGVHLGGPSAPPDRQCLQNCQQVNRLCLGGARIDAQSCAQTTCSDESQAAQDACGTDRMSEACHSAVNAWRTCVQPCRNTFKGAIGTCLTAGQTCRMTCASSTPPAQPDAQCVAGCRSSLQGCRLAAGTVAQGCNADCRPLITTAEQTCAADPRSSACSTALQTALACLQPCNQTQRLSLQACLQTAQSCVAACPSATPTPAP